MCIVSWASLPTDSSSKFKLIIVSNRDEDLKRDTTPFIITSKESNNIGDIKKEGIFEEGILTAIDKEHGGSWMALSTTTGAFCSLTNFRGEETKANMPSRGELPKIFTNSKTLNSSQNYLTSKATDYAGFNLVFCSSVFDENNISMKMSSNKNKDKNESQSKIIESNENICSISNGYIEDKWIKMKRVEEGLSFILNNQDEWKNRRQIIINTNINTLSSFQLPFLSPTNNDTNIECKDSEVIDLLKELVILMSDFNVPQSLASKLSKGQIPTRSELIEALASMIFIHPPPEFHYGTKSQTFIIVTKDNRVHWFARTITNHWPNISFSAFRYHTFTKNEEQNSKKREREEEKEDKKSVEDLVPSTKKQKK